MAKSKTKTRRIGTNERFWTIASFATFALIIGLILWRFLAAPAGSTPYASGPGTGDAARDLSIAALVNALAPPQKSKLAHALNHWHQRTSSPPDASAPGIVSGPENAPVNITAWVDVECTGSRELVATLSTLTERYPSEVRVDLRSLPQRESCGDDGGERNVRCLAAFARACLATHPKAPAFDRALFTRPAPSPDFIYATAAAYVDAATLKECLQAPTTRARVQRWMDEGRNRHIDETPLAIANGRHAGRFLPFLELLVLTRGTGVHPALRDVPRGH